MGHASGKAGPGIMGLLSLAALPFGAIMIVVFILYICGAFGKTAPADGLNDANNVSVSDTVDGGL